MNVPGGDRPGRRSLPKHTPWPLLIPRGTSGCPVPPASVPVLPHPLPHVQMTLSVCIFPGPHAPGRSLLGGQGMLVDAEFSIWTQVFCPGGCPVLGPRFLPLPGQQRQNFPASARLLFYLLVCPQNCVGKVTTGGRRCSCGIPALSCLQQC